MKISRSRTKTQKSTGRRGFTLIEIMIVLAILAVIIGMVLPNLIQSQREASIRTARIAVKAVEAAAEMYAADHNGEFPAGGQGLDVLMHNGGNDPNWKGPYLKGTKLPTDPWGQPIQYNSPGSHTSDGAPDIWSNGPDKASGTADDINNWVQ